MKGLLFLLITVFTISSCELVPCLTKDSFVSSSNDTYKKFKKNQEDFSDNDWEIMDAQHKTFLEDCYPKYQKELSDDELKDFWLKTTQYFVKRAYKGPDMNKELKALYGKHFEKYMEKMGDRFANKFKDLININVDNAIDKLFDMLGELGKELQEE